MHLIRVLISSLLISMTIITFSVYGHSDIINKGVLVGPFTKKNDIPPRLEWNANFGYCGEIGLISAGLFYGQYMSQYTARSIASKNKPQNLQGSQLLLGVNDQYAASKMHLHPIEWDTAQEQNTRQFLAWVKQNVVRGFPVSIGVYANQYLFYGDTNPHAGDADYDHIVVVTGISSNHALSDPHYYADDIIYFSDNGLWTGSGAPTYHFSYPFANFQANRTEANNPNGLIYSLANDGSNFGLALAGVIDTTGKTLPIKVQTDVNYEKPEIKNGSNTPPKPMPLSLTITVSGLKPGVLYHLYRYNTIAAVPNANFNAHANAAYEKWDIKIPTGSTYVMSQKIQSNEIAIYRAVKASAP